MVARAAGTPTTPAAAVDPSLPVELSLTVNDTSKSLRIDARTMTPQLHMACSFHERKAGALPAFSSQTKPLTGL
jgi:hypothetical protein